MKLITSANTQAKYLLILFFLAALSGVYGHTIWASLSILAIYAWEGWYVYSFLRYGLDSSRRLLTLICSVIAVSAYTLFFTRINNLELWVDEIQVIRYGQFPLRSIAQEVMAHHVAVPPLDYWNMWAWDKVVSLFPVSLSEGIYRLPYMVLHFFAALLLVYISTEIVINRSRLMTAGISVFVFSLYFFNPLPFVYSYEVRFYSMLLLGVVVVLALYYKGKLFSYSYFPLILIFCLNSVYHFFILAPFLVKGIIDRSTRKNSALLSCAVLVMGFMFVRLLYVPKPEAGIYPAENIMNGLVWLNSFYFDALWKRVAAGLMLLLLVLYRRKNAVFLFASVIFYLLVIIGLDMKYNYQYFGGKHFLFVIPFFTVMLIELIRTWKSAFARVCIIALISFMLLYPFATDTRNIYDGKLMFAKSPIGLKQVFQYATDNNIGTIIVDYGNASETDIQYYTLAISWYLDHYPKIKIIEQANFYGCRRLEYTNAALLYSVYGIPDCKGIPGRMVTKVFDGAMITK